MKPKRLLSLVAALGLFAALIPLTTGVALAWSPPGIKSACSDDSAVHNWTVTLASESNYNIDWADNSSFTSDIDRDARRRQLTFDALIGDRALRPLELGPQQQELGHVVRRRLRIAVPERDGVPVLPGRNGHPLH